MLRPRRQSLPPLLSPHEVRELASWLKNKHPGDPGRITLEERNLWHEGVLGLRKLWAASQALAGEVSALPKIAAWLEDEETEDHDTFEALARAVRVLASRDPKHRKYLRALADHAYGVVQREAVKGLDPNDAGDRKVLEKLLHATAAPWVAAEVQKKLQRAGLGHWWRGIFTEDPLVGLDTEEQGEVLPVARKLTKLFGAEELTDEEREAIPPLLEQLPARPALDAARTVLKSRRHRVPGFALLSAVCRHEAAPAMWVDLLDHGAEDDSDDDGGAGDLLQIFRHGEDAQRFPEPFAAAVADGALARLARYTAADAEEFDTPASRLAWLLREIWPPGRDPKPVLDLLLAWGEGGGEKHHCGFLDGVVSKNGQGHPWVRPTFERALRDSFRAPWQLLEEALPALVKDEPAEVRLAWAMEVVRRREPGPALKWAMGQLREETPAFLLERYDDPILRLHVIEPRIPPELFDRVRADFLAGRLTLEEAEGAVDQFAPRHLVSPYEKPSTWKYVLEYARAGRPLTDEEWDAVRTYRERYPAPEVIRHMWLGVWFPHGPWHPRDFAWLERAREAMLEDSAENPHGYLENLVWAAANKADARLLPLLEDAFERCHWMDQEEAIEKAIAMVRKQLGLPAEEGEGDDDE